MTTRDVAEKAGFSISIVNKLERDEARWNADHLHRISHVLDVTPAWLVGGGDKQTPPDTSIDTDPFVAAVQGGDPLAIARAFAAMIRQVPPRAPDGDPIRAKLLDAYDRRDWRTLMKLSGKLADQWG
jgi:transcriptional regulator with XRE-family HTH domain